MGPREPSETNLLHTGPCYQGRRSYGGTARTLSGPAGGAVRGIPQHPDEHRPQRPVLLAVDQEPGEGAGLGGAPVRADPLRPLGVGEHQDVEEFGAGCGAEGVETVMKLSLELLEVHRKDASSQGPSLGVLWPLEEVSMSRASCRGGCVLRASGGVVDLDRYPLRVGSRVDQLKRHVRAGVGE
jgi:hypothetical protein